MVTTTLSFINLKEMKSRHMYPNPKLNFALVSSKKKGIFLPLFPHEKKKEKK